ncbi:hypothetical protein Pfo_023763 [Paulownia fortunei]|nr:hypothetical protein Pfo_023763 [Paulownia fortunei]
MDLRLRVISVTRAYKRKPTRTRVAVWLGLTQAFGAKKAWRWGHRLRLRREDEAILVRPTLLYLRSRLGVRIGCGGGTGQYCGCVDVDNYETLDSVVEEKRRGLSEIRGFGARDFMSASFDLAVVLGAPSKLCFSLVSSLSARCMRKSLCCALQQSNLTFFPTVSMRLRPKRTCSGVVCFGGYHINRLFNLFLFLRGPLT